METLYCKGEPYRFCGLRDLKLHANTDKHHVTFISITLDYFSTEKIDHKIRFICKIKVHTYRLDLVMRAGGPKPFTSYSIGDI